MSVMAVRFCTLPTGICKKHTYSNHFKYTVDKNFELRCTDLDGSEFSKFNLIATDDFAQTVQLFYAFD